MAIGHNNSEGTANYSGFISERTQKITEALYRVTDLFPDAEPLKWLARKTGMDIFSQISILIKNPGAYENSQSLKALFNNFSHILSLLELASAGSFISHINYEVLKREYSALRDFIEDKKENFLLLSLDISYGKNLLEQNKDLSIGHSNGHDNIPIGHSIGHSIGHNNEHENKEKNNASLNSDKTNNPYQNAAKKELLGNNPQKFKNNSRHKAILDFLENNGRASVSEISAIFKGNIGEKTIQRDLSVMAEQGILKKEGSKRWRKYTIKTANL